MRKEKYTIKEEEEIDISGRDARVSMSFKGKGRSGSPVLTFETDDGTRLSIVMSREQAVELKMCAMRSRHKDERDQAMEEAYERLAPSRLALEEEIHLLLSDGICRLNGEIAVEVAQSLRLPTDLCMACGPLGRRYFKDVDEVLGSMVASGELVEDSGAYHARASRWDRTA
jgi:hypothetical protein